MGPLKCILPLTAELSTSKISGISHKGRIE